MSSASELFYNRRSRVSRTFAADVDGLDSPAATDLHFRGHNFYNRRRLSRHRRSDFDDFDPLRRSSDGRQPSRRSSQLEHGSLRLDDACSQYNSISNVNVDIPSTATSVTQERRMNERLPGAVLLARERLLQRLRGLSLSENRQQSRMPMHVRMEQLDWDAETLIGWLARGNLSTGQNSGISLQTYSPKTSKPPGLTQEALNHLHLEVFNRVEPTQDCSICLETFENGDKLIRLPCSHHFHSACLDPWVRCCGDCPCCRKCILAAEDGERT